MIADSPLQALFGSCGTAELVTPALRLSATALQHGANDWVRALRRAGVTRGDRIVCALPNGAAFAQLVLATLAEGITLAPMPDGSDVTSLLDSLDARLGVATQSDHANVAVPSRTGGPPAASMIPRVPSIRTEHIAFLLRTSGTTGTPRWVGLSDSGVLSVLESHLPHLDVDGTSVLCVLPWHHAFGLVLGLLPAVLRARRIVVSNEAARDTTLLIATAREQAVTHLNMVPLTAARLVAADGGHDVLHALRGGLIGGAPIDAALAPLLTSTRLRVGYGQTEASPGIMLGGRGEFSTAFLGRPIGCDVRIDDDNVLAFRGRNVCAGFWEQQTLRLLPFDRWHRTDDIVMRIGDAFAFVGRATLAFKLANGTVVNVPVIERALRQHVPALRDVVLSSSADSGIEIRFSSVDGDTIAGEDFAGVLGGLRSWVRGVYQVRHDEWKRSPKGEIDRRRLPARD